MLSVKALSVVVIISYIWFVFWQFFLKDNSYPSPLGISFIVTATSIVFLIQSLSISYYWRLFATQKLYYKVYSFVIIPILLIIFQYIMLIYSTDEKPYEYINIWLWIVEFLLLEVFISPLMLVVGEYILPRVDPERQLIWTKKFPPEKIDDMYRGFLVVLVFLLIPPFLSFISRI